MPDGSVAFVLNVLGNDSIAPDVGETLTITSFSIVSGDATEVVITRFNDRLEVATQLGYFNKPDLVLNYTISDGNGGTANGGQDTSAPKTFTITVNNVNDAPTFTLGPDQTVAEGAALTTLPGFVSNVGPGLLDPAQTVTVSVTNVAADSTLTFSTPPTITNGTLTFQADTHAFGTAIVTVTAKDDGGTDNGGEDTTIKTFTITVNEGNDPPTANPDFASIPDGSVNFEVDVLGNDSSGPDVGAPGEMLMIQSVDTTGLPPEVRITSTPAISCWSRRTRCTSTSPISRFPTRSSIERLAA